MSTNQEAYTVDGTEPRSEHSGARNGAMRRSRLLGKWPRRSRAALGEARQILRRGPVVAPPILIREAVSAADSELARCVGMLRRELAGVP